MGQEAANALPEHRSYDHRIDLKEDKIPPWGPIYPLSETELQALWEWLKDIMSTGKIPSGKKNMCCNVVLCYKRWEC